MIVVSSYSTDLCFFSAAMTTPLVAIGEEIQYISTEYINFTLLISSSSVRN